MIRITILSENSIASKISDSLAATVQQRLRRSSDKEFYCSSLSVAQNRFEQRCRRMRFYKRRTRIIEVKRFHEFRTCLVLCCLHRVPASDQLTVQPNQNGNQSFAKLWDFICCRGCENLFNCFLHKHVYICTKLHLFLDSTSPTRGTNVNETGYTIKLWQFISTDRAKVTCSSKDLKSHLQACSVFSWRNVWLCLKKMMTAPQCSFYLNLTPWNRVLSKCLCEAEQLQNI